MLKGLGPITLALMLLAKPKYPAKIRKALLENLAHLPMIDKIVDILELQKGNWKSLMGALADYLLIVSHRGVRRFYFPLEVLMLAERQTPNLGLDGNFPLMDLG
ncbi:hypothetical protein EVAR_70449_1 [Eumeta japonica]|uniref:Uncharacterized protein n=1 Tax=Eumeta variegata TaxID=151549 RepID=A0A4C2AFB2_EUMVA|nr:hypothetical protein EVAR_70449_1 [Eumeta japonica]